MSSYLELKAQLATLDLTIEVALAGEKAKAIREIQARMIEWRIRPQDLQDGTARQRNKTSRKSFSPHSTDGRAFWMRGRCRALPYCFSGAKDR